MGVKGHAASAPATSGDAASRPPAPRRGMNSRTWPAFSACDHVLSLTPPFLPSAVNARGSDVGRNVFYLAPATKSRFRPVAQQLLDCLGVGNREDACVATLNTNRGRTGQPSRQQGDGSSLGFQIEGVPTKTEGRADRATHPACAVAVAWGCDPRTDGAGIFFHS